MTSESPDDSASRANSGSSLKSERVGYTDPMSVVSIFFSIVIRMYYREHEVPHFHAEYQGQQAMFALEGEVLAGALRSPTAHRLIQDWTTTHRAELEANWERIKAGEPIERIAPLD